ncbi:hypothetical protein B0H12DRAFT_56791 [Mycena haematopus]|nr:hypothetical protein B0H12DRAFT_56791 [Mycena haematopus]
MSIVEWNSYGLLPTCSDAILPSTISWPRRRLTENHVLALSWNYLFVYLWNAIIPHLHIKRARPRVIGQRRLAGRLHYMPAPQADTRTTNLFCNPVLLLSVYSPLATNRHRRPSDCNMLSCLHHHLHCLAGQGA